MKNIFIDSDCGIDDATAIMIALASPDIKVTGISAVAGNAGLDHVVNNITGILSYFGREDIPVYKGASTSLLGERIHAEGVHGSNGLGDVELPPNSKTVESLMAPDGGTIFIGGLIRDRKEEIKSRVPGLGAIPLLGALFSKTTNITVRTEIIVLITPHIITADNKDLLEKDTQKVNEVEKSLKKDRSIKELIPGI